MNTKFVEASKQSAILGMSRTVSSVAAAQTDISLVNALDVQSEMGIGLETLAHAIKADVKDLEETPRAQQWQSGLHMMVQIWEHLLILFGDEENARLFLTKPRPELRNQSAISYFDQGRPAVVLNLLFSMREMLP